MLSPRQPGAVEESDGARGDGQQGHKLPLLAFFRKAGRSTRIIRNSQSSRPTNSAICHARPRSTYS